MFGSDQVAARKARILVHICAAFCLLQCVTEMEGQNETCPPRKILVSVVDQDGQTVPGLGPGDFRLRLRNRPVKISDAAQKNLVPRIIILIDTSGSMTVGKKFQVAIDATAYLIRQAPAGSSFALLTFGSTVEVVSELTPDRTVLLQRLKRISLQTPHGRTALWDAVHEGLVLLGTPVPGDVICAISDEADNVSKTSQSVLERELLETGNRLFSFSIREEGIGVRSLTPEELSGPDAFSELVADSGGATLPMLEAVPGDSSRRTLLSLRVAPRSIAEMVQRLLGVMTSVYELDFQLPVGEKKPGDLRLEVLDPGGKRLGKVQIFSPRRAIPCTP